MTLVFVIARECRARSRLRRQIGRRAVVSCNTNGLIVAVERRAAELILRGRDT